jgi:hypothetical protein
MIDIVYPLIRSGSRIDDAELRYSLRSVVQNVRLPLGQVYLFGHRPRWIHDVVHVSMEDKADKAMNLREKYLRMTTMPELSDPFLLLDDDHLFLRPASEIPVHTRGMLADYQKEFRSTSYGRYLATTYRQLVKEKLPLRNYQIHYPMLIRKPILARAVAMMTGPMVMGSLYGNIVDGETVEITHDFRIRRSEHFSALQDGAFLSFPPILRPEWVTFLASRFPEPSRWEAA